MERFKKRWTPARKAALLGQIDRREVSEADAIREHDLSAEELAEWRRKINMGGVQALRETKTQVWRKMPAA